MHTAQLMSMPLTVSCFSKIQIGFTFLVPAHPGSPGQRAVKQVSQLDHPCQVNDVTYRIITTTTLQPFHGSQDFVQDYPGKLVPER